jgi:hypothetical protein
VAVGETGAFLCLQSLHSLDTMTGRSQVPMVTVLIDAGGLVKVQACTFNMTFRSKKMGLTSEQRTSIVQH